MAYTSLREAHAQPSEKTDRGSVYKNVTLIKSGLGNRRDKNYYPAHVLESAVNDGLFEGLRAFADHPDSVSEEVQPERTVRDLVGIYENANYNPDSQSVQADLRVLRSHKWLSETIDELLESGHGDKIGLSINGRGQTEPKRMKLEESGRRGRSQRTPEICGPAVHGHRHRSGRRWRVSEPTRIGPSLYQGDVHEDSARAVRSSP